jgi:Sec-independent protein secretion pathway component TatC
LPLVMLALGWFGILTPEAIREWWRVVVLAVFVLAALLTPPDPFTQLLLALPMLVLFLIGYYLVKWANRHNR